MDKKYEKKKKELANKIRGHEDARKIAEYRKKHGRSPLGISIISGGKAHKLDTHQFDFKRAKARGERNEDTGFHGSSLFPKKK